VTTTIGGTTSCSICGAQRLRGLLIGFESLTRRRSRSEEGLHMRRDYFDVVRTIHVAGIAIMAASCLLRSRHAALVRRAVGFVLDSHIDCRDMRSRFHFPERDSIGD